MLMFYLTLIDGEENKSKFETIYYEYRERMYYAALDVVHNNEDAEDAVHNAFIGIAKNINSVGEPDSKQTCSYVIKAAKNAAINIYNKNNKAAFTELNENIKLSDGDFFERLCIKDRYNEVVKAIMKLKDIYKIPMYYYYVCEMKAKDIAVLTGTGVSTVKMRLQRGKAELLRQLGEDADD